MGLEEVQETITRIQTEFVYEKYCPAQVLTFTGKNNNNNNKAIISQLGSRDWYPDLIQLQLLEIPSNTSMDSTLKDIRDQKLKFRQSWMPAFQDLEWSRQK